MNALFAWTTLLAGALLTLNVWPGWYETALGGLGVLIVPPVVVVTLARVGRGPWIDLFGRRSVHDGVRLRAWGLYSLASAVLGGALLVNDVPRRALFALYADDFDDLVAADPSGMTVEAARHRLRIGPWTLRSVRRGAHGSLYFEIHSSIILGMITTYGFAWRAEADDDDAPYLWGVRLTHLVGEWSSFGVISE